MTEETDSLPEGYCLKCQALLWKTNTGVWKTWSLKSRPTCPTGGPHISLTEYSEVQVCWDSWENVLEEWEQEG